MTISVVIPCRNEVSAIEKCVTHIFSSKFVANYELKEVFIVDGMSDDGTIDKIINLQIKYPALKLIKNEQQVTPVAFNLGIKHSSGNFIQIIGARQFVDDNYLQECINAFSLDDKIGCVGGAVRNTYSNKMSEIIAMAMDSPFGVGGSNFRIKKESGLVDTVGTPMYKKEIFEEVGLFDENLVRNQDDEFNYRLTSNGYKIFFTHKAIIQYEVRASFKKLWKQYFQYGYWKVYVNRKVGSITTVRQLFPAILVSAILLGGVLSLLSIWMMYLWILGMISYLTLSLFFAVKKTTQIGLIPYITLTFWILHFSYGLGYLKGMLHFLLLNKNPSAKNKELSR